MSVFLVYSYREAALYKILSGCVLVFKKFMCDDRYVYVLQMLYTKLRFMSYYDMDNEPIDALFRFVLTKQFRVI